MKRRDFLQTAAGLAALSSVRPVRAQAQQTGPIGANERIRMAVIGCGSRSGQVLTSFGQLTNNVFVAAADVFKERLDAMTTRLSTGDNKVEPYEDYRRILDRQDVDAVLIGTPDHWHPQMTIDTCAAGKDVFLEKPAGNTLEPCVKMLDAVRRHQRIVQLGTQQRSWSHFQEAAQLVKEGAIGTVSRVVIQMNGGGNPVREEPTDVPAGLNWEMFQGPASRKPYKVGRHRQWRYYWDYGGGLITDWGVHLADVGTWFMGADRKAPQMTTAVGLYADVQNPDPERPQNAFMVTWQYDNFLMSFTNVAMSNPDFPLNGNVFYGTRGSLLVNRTGYQILPSGGGRGGGRGEAPAGAAGQPAAARGAVPAPPAQPPIQARTVRPAPESEAIVVATTAHCANFLDCVKSRKAPVSDIEVGFYSTLPTLLGVAALRQGKALTWDAKSRTAKAV